MNPEVNITKRNTRTPAPPLFSDNDKEASWVPGKEDATIIDILKQENKNMQEFIKNQFKEYEKSLEYNSKLVHDLTITLSGVSQEIKELKKKNEELEIERVALRSEVSALKTEVLDLQQYSRRKNLEISGVPESENEDLPKLLCALFESDQITEKIRVAHRIPNSKKDKHKSIIVQFDTKANRNMYLSSYKKTNKLASDLSKNFNQTPIYVNEHLAPALKHLLYLAKTFKRENNFKYCWIKDGKLFLKQNEDARAFRIRSENDLKNLMS